MSMIVNPHRFGLPAPTDPYFAFVKMLCHFDTDTLGSLVNSAVPGNTGTLNGATALTTSNVLYGPKALTCNGSNDRASFADSTDYGLGTGAFAFEFSFFTASPSQSNKTLAAFGTGFGATEFEIYINGGAYKVYAAGADKISGGTVATSTYQPICYFRTAGGTGYLAVGGSIIGSWADGTNYAHKALTFGSEGGGGGYSAGNFDEGRLTVGSARGYTGSGYTPAVAAFPDS